MTVSYSYEQSLMTVTNGEKKRVAYSIVDGDKGATYNYLHKDNSSFKKVRIVEKEGKFEVKTKINEDEKTDVLDEKDFKDLIKKDKDLAFIVDYIKNTKKTGGSKMKRSSKKVIKKASKKVSKKTSKKVVRRRRTTKK